MNCVWGRKRKWLQLVQVLTVGVPGADPISLWPYFKHHSPMWLLPESSSLCWLFNGEMATYKLLTVFVCNTSARLMRCWGKACAEPLMAPPHLHSHWVDWGLPLPRQLRAQGLTSQNGHSVDPQPLPNSSIYGATPFCLPRHMATRIVPCQSCLLLRRSGKGKEKAKLQDFSSIWDVALGKRTSVNVVTFESAILSGGTCKGAKWIQHMHTHTHTLYYF